MIIDFHTHTFPEKSCARIVDHLAHVAAITPYTDGSVSGLLSSMKEARIRYSVTLPVMTRPDQVEKINSSLIENAEYLFSEGIIPFGGLHPDYEDYKEELKRLKNAGIRGIKLHPAYQNMDFDDIRMLRILDEASSLGLIILVHAGIDIGLPTHNFCSVRHILHVLKDVAPEKLILAHLGNWGCWDEVEYYLTKAPLWFDTSFSCGKITPLSDSSKKPYRTELLSFEDFTRIVRKHGTNLVLFGTDSPWSSQKECVKLLEEMPFTQKEKDQLFYENAAALLDLKG